MVSVESISRIAEAAGKGIGAGWLLFHYGRATWKAARLKSETRRAARLSHDSDQQIAQIAQDAETGRLVRDAVFNQLDLEQQITNLKAVIDLRDQEIAQYKTLSEQYKQSAHEWQEDASTWRSQARQDRQVRQAREESGK